MAGLFQTGPHAQGAPIGLDRIYKAGPAPRTSVTPASLITVTDSYCPSLSEERGILNLRHRGGQLACPAASQGWLDSMQGDVVPASDGPPFDLLAQGEPIPSEGTPIHFAGSSGLDSLDPKIRRQLQQYVQDTHAYNANSSRALPSLGQQDLTGEDAALGIRQSRYPAPGVFTLVNHGRQPYQPEHAEDNAFMTDLARNPWVSPKDGVWITDQLLKRAEIPEGAVVLMASCNAGTKRRFKDKNGKDVYSIAASEFAQKSGHIVVAPVEGKVNVSSSAGTVLVRNPNNSTATPSWRVFYPDGTSGSL